MDRSYEFKRVALYWQSVLQHGPTIEDKDHILHGVGDKFSSVSSVLFDRLLALDALTSPYILVDTCGIASKSNPQNAFILPKKQNVSSFIRSKRTTFNRIGINHIVHDTKVIGELISHVKGTLETESAEKCGTRSKSDLEEHRRGIVRCLNHVLQIVRNNLQDYERFRLKTESSLNNCMKTMIENMSEYRIAGASGNNTVSGSYISCFLPSLDKSHHLDNGESNSYEVVCGESDCGSSGATSPIPDVGKKLPIRPNKGNYSQIKHKLSNNEIYDQQISDIVVEQHAALINNIADEIQANELNTINNVQERLTEISSMFEKFTGTLVEQLDLFENINANVIESISNIEKTQDSLKKANSDGIPFYHLIMCYGFLGLAALLLFVDYIKSTKGAYLY